MGVKNGNQEVARAKRNEKRKRRRGRGTLEEQAYRNTSGRVVMLLETQTVPKIQEHMRRPPAKTTEEDHR